MSPDLLKAVGDYGMGAVCLVVLVCLHVYNVRVTLPTLAANAQKQIDDLIKSNRTQIDSLMSAFREELAAERAQCHDDHQKLFEAVNGNTQAILRLSLREEVRK